MRSSSFCWTLSQPWKYFSQYCFDFYEESGESLGFPKFPEARRAFHEGDHSHRDGRNQDQRTHKFQKQQQGLLDPLGIARPDIGSNEPYNDKQQHREEQQFEPKELSSGCAQDRAENNQNQADQKQ